MCVIHNPQNQKVQDRKVFSGRPDLLATALSDLLMKGNFVLVQCTLPLVELVSIVVFQASG